MLQKPMQNACEMHRNMRPSTKHVPSSLYMIIHGSSTHICIYIYHHHHINFLGVPKMWDTSMSINRKNPNHPFWGTSIYGNLHIFQKSQLTYHWKPLLWKPHETSIHYKPLIMRNHEKPLLWKPLFINYKPSSYWATCHSGNCTALGYPDRSA